VDVADGLGGGVARVVRVGAGVGPVGFEDDDEGFGCGRGGDVVVTCVGGCVVPGSGFDGSVLRLVERTDVGVSGRADVVVAVGVGASWTGFGRGEPGAPGSRTLTGARLPTAERRPPKFSGRELNPTKTSRAVATVASATMAMLDTSGPRSDRLTGTSRVVRPSPLSAGISPNVSVRSRWVTKSYHSDVARE
jgi:hypothetical protein